MPTTRKGSSTDAKDIDLLSLPSLDQHPEVQEAIQEKEPLSVRLTTLEEAMHTTRREMAFFSQKGQSDPATAATLAQAAREKLQTLEREHTETIGLLRHANAVIAEVTEATRRRLIPELAQVAIPEIDARLHTLEVIDAVQRLVGRPTPLRTLRETYKLERRYLQELRDQLTALDPS